MRYLYGDATSFPLTDNFIDVVVKAVEVCAGLYRAQVAADREQARCGHVRAATERSLSQLEALELHIEGVVKAALTEAEPDVVTAAGQVARAVRQLVSRTASAVSERLDASGRPKVAAVANNVVELLGAMLVAHELPGTTWGVHWQSGMAPGEAKVDLRAALASDIVATFTAEVPSSGRWSGPVLVSDLEKFVSIELEHVGKRRTKWRAINFDRWWITEFERTQRQGVMTLRKHPKKRGHGYRFQFQKAPAPVLVVEVDENGLELGPPHPLVQEEAVSLRTLWSHIEESVMALVSLRKQMTSLCCGESTLPRLHHPARLAEAILVSVGPLTRSIMERSRGGGELILKRAVGNGRREEIFVSRDRLTEMISDLPQHYERAFSALGIVGEPSSSPYLQMVIESHEEADDDAEAA